MHKKSIAMNTTIKINSYSTSGSLQITKLVQFTLDNTFSYDIFMIQVLTQLFLNEGSQ